jgi:hypothetical protein
MPKKVLSIPQDTNLPVKVGDDVYIKVIKNCQWCYSDPTPCFSGGLLPNGSYTATTPPTEYGPYLATAAGTVKFCTPINPPCDPNNCSAKDVPQTIIVSN